MYFPNITLLLLLVFNICGVAFTKHRFECPLCECYVGKFRRNYDKFEDFPEYPQAKVFNSVYKTVRVTNNNEKIFATACIKCLLCETIAREFHIKLTPFYKPPKPYKVLYNSVKLNSTLKSFCDNSFQNFDLREDNGSRFIGKISKYSKHVNCGVEGLWPVKLKEMCKDFMKYGEFDLHKRWINEVSTESDTVDLFCRSYGIFQYCRNLNMDIGNCSGMDKKNNI